MKDQVRHNLITDVAGVSVGEAHDSARATGVTTVLFDRPASASVSILGGAPGTRDTALLEPEMTVDAVDAVVLSGGSAFGLDAAGGAMAALKEQGRGFAVGPIRVPIVPQAILFDLLNGGDKDWGAKPPYWDLGFHATKNASKHFTLGTAGAGFGATTATLKGGLGSASAVTQTGFTLGAIVAVNAVGSPTLGDGPHFWAAPYERDHEFGGLGWPRSVTTDDLRPRLKGTLAPANTVIACIATDARLSKAECKRIALAAHDGLARAIRPAHTPLDGDTIFAAATGHHTTPVDVAALTDLCIVAADTLARAVARGIFEAERLPFSSAQPSWQDRFGRP